MESLDLLGPLIQLVTDALGFLPQPPRQVLGLTQLALNIKDLLSDLFVLVDEILKLALGLVERGLEDSVLVDLSAQPI